LGRAEAAARDHGIGNDGQFRSSALCCSQTRRETGGGSRVEEALSRIEEARAKGSLELDLSERGLTSLPDLVAALTNLPSLITWLYRSNVSESRVRARTPPLIRRITFMILQELRVDRLAATEAFFERVPEVDAVFTEFPAQAYVAAVVAGQEIN